MSVLLYMRNEKILLEICILSEIIDELHSSWIVEVIFLITSQNYPLLHKTIVGSKLKS